MTTELIVYRDSAVEAMTHLDEFTTKMEEFIKKHPAYTYKSSIKKDNTRWEITVTVDKDEQGNTTTA